MVELHIPIRIRKNRETSQWIARCSCGGDGPSAPDPNAAEDALATAHRSVTPEGCELCGRASHGRTIPTQPWRTYRVLTMGGGRWAYACRHDASCRQAQLGVEASLETGHILDGTPDPRHPLLTSSIRDLDDLSTAIAAHHVAAARAPHNWHDITTGAGDQQALAAKVVALQAIAAEAQADQRMAIAAARHSGVTWGHLSALLEFTTGEELRQWYLEEWVALYDWPWPADEPPEDWRAVLAPDEQP